MKALGFTVLRPKNLHGYSRGSFSIFGGEVVDEGKDGTAQQTEAGHREEAGEVGAGGVEQGAHQDRPADPGDPEHKVEESLCAGVVSTNLR